jgi:flotillin
VPDNLLEFVGGGVIPVLLIVIVLVLVVAYMGSRYKVAGANEALIVSGRRERGAEGGGLKVVRGQGVIVLPLLNKVGRLHLSARQINVQLPDAVTKQGIKCAVQGVATLKIGSDEESIRAAAERFLEREDQIDGIVKNVLEGSLRSIVGTLTVEELNYDRAKFQQEVQSAARGDLATSGLTIDNFTIQAIRDEVGYMDLIGQQETARRERDARMAKAQADQEAAVREAEAQQIKLSAQKDVALRQADVEAQTQAAEAKAAQAGPLAHAEATQEVTRKQTELAQLEADRKQKELIATTIRPAEADADAQVKRAEGEKLARIAQAQAEAERVRLAGQAEASIQVMKGEAQAKVTEVNAQANAKQTQLEGNAEAGIVFTKGEAEAKALALRAEAYRQFNEAAVIQTVLSMLPEIVRAAAEPMSAIDNLTVLSSDGASDLVRNSTRTVAEASAAVKGLTGIDVPALIGSSMGTWSGAKGKETSSSRPPQGTPPKAGPAKAGGGRSTRPARTARPAIPAPPPMTAGLDVVRAASAMADEVASGAQATAAAAEQAARRAGGADVADLSRASTVSDAAAALARDLQKIPGIQRFGDMKLDELENAGPRPLRTVWRIARDKLDREYGQLTIGEVLDRYGHGGGLSAGA